MPGKEISFLICGSQAPENVSEFMK